MKPDGVESMVMAVAITILVSLVVGLVFLLIHFTLEAAPLRMAALIVSSFLFLYLGSASKLGPVGSIIALVIAYVMTLLSNIPMEKWPRGAVVCLVDGCFTDVADYWV